MNVEPETGSIWANSPAPSVCVPEANQKVAVRSKLKFSLSPAGTVIAPLGAVLGPYRTEWLSQTLAGGAAGADRMAVLAAAAAADPGCYTHIRAHET
jgi:hypothetical protein